MRFENKVAMVTGASVGIGRACAVRLAKEGAKLVLFDINAEQLDKVKEEVAPYTTDVLTYTCDVSDEAAVNAAVADAMQHFGRIDVPSVVVTNDAHELGFLNLSSVSTDDCKGAACAVEHLLSCGHRDIIVLGGDRAISDTSAKRYEGCVEAFWKNGLTFDDETMYYTGRYSYEFGYNGMKQVLRERKKLTAVFAMADVIAIGAIRALFDEGLRVPEDISVAGYDGLRIGGYFVPKLTTIAQSVDLLAERSFDLLLACMQGAQAQHLTVPFRLLTRQSVRQITE